MSRYNGHFHSKFMGCMIVGKLRDEGRQRDVTCYAIAGEPDVVGYYDGIDTWVGSASTCGSKVVQQELAAVHAGEPREIEFGQTRQRMFDLPGIMGNPALEVMQGTARPRKRAVVPFDGPPAPNPSPATRRRVVAVPDGPSHAPGIGLLTNPLPPSTGGPTGATVHITRERRRAT